MEDNFDKYSLGNEKLDQSTVDAYRNICEAMTVAIRTNMSNKNSNRFTDSKFGDWKTQILMDMNKKSFQPNKQVLIRGINVLLSKVNLKMTSLKSSHIVLRTDALEMSLNENTKRDIVEKNKMKLLNNTLSYKNELALADMQIENGIPDSSLEEDGLVFLVAMVLAIHGGKMKYNNFETSMERFLDIYKTECGMKKLNFTDYISSLNTSGYVKMFDGDKDMQEVKQNDTQIERCIKLGPAATLEITPVAIARFIAEIKGMSFNEVLKEHLDINKLLKQDMWETSQQGILLSTEKLEPSQNKTTESNQPIRASLKRKRDTVD
ncbi:hypothetical protein QEN19_001286 [Hanseniaspora menglaensis]